MEGFRSDESSHVSPAAPPNEAFAMFSPPPIELRKAEKPPEAASPAPIPKPRKSRVAGLLPNSVDELIINSFKPEDPLDGSPSPSPDARKLFSSFTPLFQCEEAEAMVEVLSCGSDEDGRANPRPRRNEELEDVAPIWAAFWSNAVADNAGCGLDT